jgi:hypothetical protein
MRIGQGLQVCERGLHVLVADSSKPLIERAELLVEAVPERDASSFGCEPTADIAMNPYARALASGK